MRTIYKYPLQLVDLQVIQMPIGAEILHVDKQGPNVFVWARVDTDASLESRLFDIVGTDQPCDLSDSWKYLGSVQTHMEQFIWHVFYL